LTVRIPAALLATIPDDCLGNPDSFVEGQASEPVVSIRLNPAKPVDVFSESSAEPVPWCIYGRYLKERPSFTADPFLHAGCYYVQEASSMFLEYALRQTVDFEQTLYMLDLCAAPGGKSTLMASLLNEDSLLVSNEVIQSRAAVLAENMSKWGRLNTWVSQSDPKHFGRLGSFFDVMAIDAPCSGSGLFRKIPSYLDEWSMDQVHLCAQRQKRILHDSYQALVQNGVLIYMTCSFSAQENEEIVDYILTQFDTESIDFSVPDEWGIVKTLSPEKQGTGFRFFPHLSKGEGFFLACFRKRDGHDRVLYSGGKTEAVNPAVMESFVNMDGKYLWEQKGLCFLLQSSHRALLNALTADIRLIKKGILAGKLIRGELIPDHELALFHQIRYPKRISLHQAEALQYLKREELNVPESSPGWYLICYRQQVLGWIKHLGRRINNYYPPAYRILSKNILPSEENG